MRYTVSMPRDDDLWWPDEQAHYIRRRGARCPGATGIEVEWTMQAVHDPQRIVRNPDPRSRTGAIRVIGYAPSAGFVVTVILDPVDTAGVTTWKTSGADLRAYGKQEGADHDG